MTFVDKKPVEERTACITSLTEKRASFTFWTSACKTEELLGSCSTQKETTDHHTLLKLDGSHHTLAPATTGRRRVLALRDSIAPDKESE